MGPWGSGATPESAPASMGRKADDALAAGHMWGCEFVQTPDAPDNECYCPTPEERDEQNRYLAAIERDGEPPEPYWVTL